jgi:hypothetical protein
MDFEHSGVSVEEIHQQIVHMPYLLTQHVKADAGIRFFETREEAEPLRGLLHIFQERVTRLNESTNPESLMRLPCCFARWSRQIKRLIHMGCQGIRKVYLRPFRLRFLPICTCMNARLFSSGIRKTFISKRKPMHAELCHHAKKRGIISARFLATSFTPGRALHSEARIAQRRCYNGSTIRLRKRLYLRQSRFRLPARWETYLSTFDRHHARIRLIREAQLVHFQSHPTFAISCLPHCADMEGALQRLVAAAQQCRLSITDRATPTPSRPCQNGWLILIRRAEQERPDSGDASADPGHMAYMLARDFHTPQN